MKLLREANIVVQYAILPEVFEKKHSDRRPNLSADVRAGKNPRIAIRGLLRPVLLMRPAYRVSRPFSRVSAVRDVALHLQVSIVLAVLNVPGSMLTLA